MSPHDVRYNSYAPEWEEIAVDADSDVSTA